MNVQSHDVTVRPCNHPIMGRTYQPVCTCGGYRGCHYQSAVRAQAAAEEHWRRAFGRNVSAR